MVLQLGGHVTSSVRLALSTCHRLTNDLFLEVERVPLINISSELMENIGP